MAKALFGGVTTAHDARTDAELVALRRRVGELEHEVERLRAAASARAQGLPVDERMLVLEVPAGVDAGEPVYS